jgi:hypothetical protein
MMCQTSMMAENVRPFPCRRIPEIGFCEEKNRLQRNFLLSIRELSTLLAEQTQAAIDSDPDFARFDMLIQKAREKKELAKYAWIAHVESHQCEVPRDTAPTYTA